MAAALSLAIGGRTALLGALLGLAVAAVLCGVSTALVARARRSENKNALLAALLGGIAASFAIMIAFLVVNMLGMTINMMIMFGLVLAVGVLVDDPIVVVEYAERKLQEGVSKKEAFILAARKMFVPVVSATFTTLGAFLFALNRSTGKGRVPQEAIIGIVYVVA